MGVRWMAEPIRGGALLKVVTVALTVIGMLAAAAAWVSSVSADLGKQKEKIEALEKRREEDRRDVREALGEVRAYVRIIDQNTQTILYRISAIEAARQEAERQAQQRRGR